MSFQKQVNVNPAPFSLGDRATNNPISTVVAGRGNLTAGLLGTTIAKFAWQSLTASTGASVVNNYSPTAPTVPDGFIANEQQGDITVWLADHTMSVYPGYPVTIMDGGDFVAQNPYGDSVIGQKVFANLFSGDVLTAATGSFPTNSFGSAAAFTATVSGYVMTVSAVTSGSLAVGQLITGTGVPFPTYIESLGNGTGSAGTYNLTQTMTISTGEAMTSQTPAGIGGCVASSVSASASSTTLTVNTVTSGTIAVGQYVSATNIPSGTYIAALGTGTGGAGTYVLSAETTGSITTQPANFSSWIETDWKVKSPGNVGDFIVIGKNA